MIGMRILIVAIVLGIAPHSLSAFQQDSTDKSNPPAPPQATPPSQASPPPNESANPAADQGQPTPPNDASEKPKETSPEEKKTMPCATQNGSTKVKCGKRGNGQRRRVVRHGSTGEPTAQLAPGMTAEQALRDRRNTEQLLISTETNLRKLSARNLNQSQQDTISQIRNYMVGSRSALQTGDLSRARNLAFKAHLLADDLIAH
jgi:hypothetical protein